MTADPSVPYPDGWLTPVPTAGEEVSSWQGRGSCRTVDPEMFYPEKGGTTGEAKTVCAGCPVRAECLDFALTHGERFGVWGGLSERERRKLRPAPDGEVCRHGHPRTEVNTRVTPGGWLECRPCHRVSVARSRLARRRVA